MTKTAATATSLCLAASVFMVLLSSRRDGGAGGLTLLDTYDRQSERPAGDVTPVIVVQQGLAVKSWRPGCGQAHMRVLANWGGIYVLPLMP
jgi:hypothetical protein